MKPNLIFIPGYYGSHLHHGSNRKFLNISQVLPFQSAPRLDEWPHLDAEIVGTAGFGFIQQSVYKKPMHLLEQQGFQVTPFAYDWRKSIQHSALLLLEHLKTQTDKVFLMGHSMGGLVLLSALIQAQAPDHSKALSKVVGMIFTATPFQGLPVLFRNFLIGTPFYYNPRYLRPDVLNTYDSPFEMLPDHVMIKTPDGNQQLDTTDIQAWKPWLEQFSSPVLGDHLFMKKIVQARKFREHLKSAASLTPDFPMLVLQARGRKTPMGYEVLANGKLQLDHWHLGPFIVPRKNFLSEDGDRTVLLKSQFLPRPLHDHATTYTTEAGHLEILKRPETLKSLATWAKDNS